MKLNKEEWEVEQRIRNAEWEARMAELQRLSENEEKDWINPRYFKPQIMK